MVIYSYILLFSCNNFEYKNIIFNIYFNNVNILPLIKLFLIAKKYSN